MPTQDDKDPDRLFGQVRPEDLLKFGLIPEFIGRLPVIATVDKLDRDALVSILTEPRNALVKQYQKLFQLDGVELEFTETAVDAVAEMANDRGTGARGLRAIIEEVLLHVMYDVPSRSDVARVVVTDEVVRENVLPTLIPRESEDKKKNPRDAPPVPRSPSPFPRQRPSRPGSRSAVTRRSPSAARLLSTIKTGAVGTRLLLWNDLNIALSNVFAIAELMSNVHPDEAVRGRAERAEQDAQRLVTDIGLDRDLYDALAEIDPEDLDERGRRVLETVPAATSAGPAWTGPRTSASA